MRVRALMLAAALATVAACTGDSTHPTIEATYAIVQILDSTGTVIGQGNVFASGSGPAPQLPATLPMRLRFLWLASDSTPDPSAADPNLSLRVLPPAGSGLTWVPSPSNRYEGMLSGTLPITRLPVPVQLFDGRQNAVVLSLLMPVTHL